MTGKLNSEAKHFDEAFQRSTHLLTIELKRKRVENTFLFDCIQGFHDIFIEAGLLQDESIPEGDQARPLIEQTALCFDTWMKTFR